MSRGASESVLADLERALCRDRSHTVIEVRPAEPRAPLLRALRERLSSSCRVVHLPANVPEGEICTRILAEMGEGSGRDAEVHLQSVLREISALVVLVEDADSLSPTALRLLGRLASVSQRALRLALIVRARPGSGPIGPLVAALGVGAEKVTLAPRVARVGQPVATAVSEPPQPRALSHEWAPSRTALDAIHVAPGRRSRGSAPLRQTVMLLLGSAVLVLGLHQVSGRTPADTGPVVHGPPPQPTERVRVAETLVSHAAPVVHRPPPQPAEQVRVAETLVSHAASEAPMSHESDLPAAPVPAPPAEPDPEPVRPAARAPTPILVSLNARPWARIEVDGRDVGVTPLADVPIAPGIHRFRAHLADGRVIEQTAHIDAYRNRVIFP